jgi:hypothetical protein
LDIEKKLIAKYWNLVLTCDLEKKFDSGKEEAKCGEEPIANIPFYIYSVYSTQEQMAE